MIMDLESYSNRDKKIIRENPEKDAHGLLMLGLSQSGYERMVDSHDSEKVAELKVLDKINAKNVEPKILQTNNEIQIAQPIIKKIEPNTKPIPKLSTATEYNSHKNTNFNGQVRVLNARTGKTILMSEPFAIKLVKGSTSNEYKIL